MFYPNSLQALNKDLARAPDTQTTRLAQRLIEGAKRLDLYKVQNLGINFRYKNVKERNPENPSSCTTEEVALASWADPLSFPLSEGEKWNLGRRATLTGTKYEVIYGGNPDGMSKDFYQAQPDHKKDACAINPYMNTGLNGRGCLGQSGPNHTVDNGIFTIKNDRSGVPTLYALGILRKYDNNAPAFSGGFAHFEHDKTGAYIFDEQAIINTKAEEFFEEMISGSIELLPEYKEKLPLLLADEVQKRAMSVRNPRFQKKLLTSEQIKILQTELEASLKLEQVKDKDPAFIKRLQDTFAQGVECFSGPVLNDNRNTNEAWIESRLSWIIIDNKMWAYLKGDKPVFDYQLSAGDDASGVVYHKIDDTLVDKAFASHGTMFTFMTASFLLDRQEKGIEIAPEIYAQIKGIAAFLDTVPSPKNDTLIQLNQD